MKDKPVRIAIPTYEGTAEKYVAVLTQLGAEVTVVHMEGDPARFDGILLPGSTWNVDPARYGREVEGVPEVKPELDQVQFTVLDRFVKAGKPVFGICRGHQLLNVYFGGTLIQNLPRKDHHIMLPADPYLAHGSVAEEDGFLFPLYGRRFPVNSSHRQAAETLGPGMRAVQWSDDGVVEATQHETLPCYSVQWHPEQMCLAYLRGDTVDGSAVLNWFLDKCRKHRAGEMG